MFCIFSDTKQRFYGILIEEYKITNLKFDIWIQMKKKTDLQKMSDFGLFG